MTESTSDHEEAPRGDPPIPFVDLRHKGMLWLINRVVFHPRGLALALCWPDGADPETDEPDGWRLFGDGSEPWAFTSEDDDRCFELAQAFLSDYVNGKEE